MLKQGMTIAGKYQIVRQLGTGGMSTVYLVMDLKLQKHWAVKVIQKHFGDKMETVLLQSAAAETAMLNQLDHPMLPRIVDRIETAEWIYIVMDYVDGRTLSKVLQKEGVQPQERVIRWAKELCGVLDYLHEQNPPIIYRDMKPENIMLQPNGRLKLIDFGLAKQCCVQNETETIVVGTKGYAAPEQMQSGFADPKTDIYSLGITLHQLLTGKDPQTFTGTIPSIREERKELSLGLDAIIQKCTKENPKQRYQNCKELLFDINHYEALSRTYWEKLQKKRNRAKLRKRFLKWAIFSF